MPRLPTQIAHDPKFTDKADKGNAGFHGSCQINARLNGGFSFD